MVYSAADERSSISCRGPSTTSTTPTGAGRTAATSSPAPDGSMLITNGYGNNPNQRRRPATGRWPSPTAGTGTSVGRRHRRPRGPLRRADALDVRRAAEAVEDRGGAERLGVEWELHYGPPPRCGSCCP